MHSGGATQIEIDAAKAIGSMASDIKTLMDRTEKMEKKLDGVVAMTNRWKGATTVLIILGGLIGWASNLLMRMAGKA